MHSKQSTVWHGSWSGGIIGTFFRMVTTANKIYEKRLRSCLLAVLMLRGKRQFILFQIQLFRVWLSIQFSLNSPLNDTVFHEKLLVPIHT